MTEGAGWCQDARMSQIIIVITSEIRPKYDDWLDPEYELL